MEPELRLKSYQDLVEVRLDEILPNAAEIPTRLHEAMRYSALAPGKRIRPAICMGAASCFGSSSNAALDVGCAIELIHCFSLIHDDLPAIDNDDLRRGRPTCHKVFGEGLAILAGDALFALAFQIVGEMLASADTKSSVLRELATAAGSQGLVGGEVLDIENEGEEPTFEILNTIHCRKTAALIACSSVCGGLVSGAVATSVDNLREYGQSLGLAFQIADDVLNVTSTPDQLGKAVGTDLSLKKMTFPSLLGVEASRQAAYESASRATSAIADLPGDHTFLDWLARFSVERLS